MANVINIKEDSTGKKLEGSCENETFIVKNNEFTIKLKNPDENNYTRLQYRTCCSEFIPVNEHCCNTGRTGVLKMSVKNSMRPDDQDIAALYQYHNLSLSIDD